MKSCRNIVNNGKTRKGHTREWRSKEQRKRETTKQLLALGALVGRLMVGIVEVQ